MNSVLSICVLSMSCSSVIMAFFLGGDYSSICLNFPFLPINYAYQRFIEVKIRQKIIIFID